MSILKAGSLSVTLGSRQVLEDVSVELSPGEILAFIGPNGSGKTTLLRALLGNVNSTGDIEWFNRPANRIHISERAKSIAYMPQTPTCDPADTVEEVLRLGRSPYRGLFGIETDADDRVIAEVARDLELAEFLTRPMSTLSGGQRQRVFLGRCLAQSPKVLLLDEPATFLDLRHQVELYRLLRKLASEQNIGIIMASHDLNLAAMHADRAVVLKDGSVLASGAIDDVMTSQIMSQAFDLPMKRIEVDGIVQIAPVA